MQHREERVSERLNYLEVVRDAGMEIRTNWHIVVN